MLQIIDKDVQWTTNSIYFLKLAGLFHDKIAQSLLKNLLLTV